MLALILLGLPLLFLLVINEPGKPTAADFLRKRDEAHSRALMKGLRLKLDGASEKEMRRARKEIRSANRRVEEWKKIMRQHLS